jgi:DNA-binding transcriptional ArsR family regulator
VKRAGAALAALGDPKRRRTVELLSEAPRRAGELAKALGLSAPAMSRHLRALKQGGLIEETHPGFDARVRVYALKREGMAALKAWVDATDALWAKQLRSFKELAERE